MEIKKKKLISLIEIHFKYLKRYKKFEIKILFSYSFSFQSFQRRDDEMSKRVSRVIKSRDGLDGEEIHSLPLSLSLSGIEAKRIRMVARMLTLMVIRVNS